jgi:hypothetical protein
MAETSALVVDRRGLLAGAGALALAAALPAAPAVARPAGALSATRAATARRLARALRAAGDPTLRDVGPGRATRRLAAWLAGQPAATRAQADAVLDLLGADGVPSPARLARAVPPADAAAAGRAAALAAAVGLLRAAGEAAHDEADEADQTPEPLALT